MFSLECKVAHDYSTALDVSVILIIIRLKPRIKSPDINSFIRISSALLCTKSPKTDLK